METKVNLNDAPWRECGCEKKCMVFEKKVMFKKISKIISPTGKEENVPVEIIICHECRKVPKFFANKINDLPEDMVADD